MLEKSTARQLMNILDTNLIIENMQIIFDNGFAILIEKQDYEYLKLIYYFFDRVGKLENLKKRWNYLIKVI